MASIRLEGTTHDRHHTPDRDHRRQVVDRLVDHFGGLQQLLSAGIDDLQAVEGVGELRARSVREGLSRLAESSITERYI